MTSRKPISCETETPTQPVSLPPPIPVKIPAIETVVPSEIKVPINTLVGILELGERSAALFERRLIWLSPTTSLGRLVEEKKILS